MRSADPAPESVIGKNVQRIWSRRVAEITGAGFLGSTATAPISRPSASVARRCVRNYVGYGRSHLLC